jgi:hypothetical protein
MVGLVGGLVGLLRLYYLAAPYQGRRGCKGGGLDLGEGSHGGSG